MTATRLGLQNGDGEPAAAPHRGGGDSFAAHEEPDVAQARVTATRYLARGIDWLDDRLAAATLGRRRERPALLGLLFHGVFADAAEIAAWLCPQTPGGSRRHDFAASG